jgi:nicotinamidase-related amidase
MPENNRSSGVWDSKECALLLIDYQPGVMSFIGSHDRKLVELNARYLTKAALAFDIPIILSTVGVQMGVNQPTIASLRNEVPNVPEIDRTSMDSWADRAFVEAVKKTGRKRLVMSGIVTEVCLAYPVVAALKDGYEVSIITDAAGGLTRESHDVAVLRMIQPAPCRIRRKR